MVLLVWARTQFIISISINTSPRARVVPSVPLLPQLLDFVLDQCVGRDHLRVLVEDWDVVVVEVSVTMTALNREIKCAFIELVAVETEDTSSFGAIRSELLAREVGQVLVSAASLVEMVFLSRSALKKSPISPWLNTR